MNEPLSSDVLAKMNVYRRAANCLFIERHRSRFTSALGAAASLSTIA